MSLIKKTVTTPNWGEHTAKLLSEWNYESNGDMGNHPLTVSVESASTVYWVCVAKGHPWRTFLAKRIAGDDCPFCKLRAERESSYKWSH